MRQAFIAVLVVGAVLMVARAVPVPSETVRPSSVRLKAVLILDRSSVQAPRGASVPVGVTLIRAGASSETVFLRHMGLVPTGVSLSFDPPELSGAQATSVLTFTVEPGFPLTAFDVEIVADRGETSVGQVLTVEIVETAAPKGDDATGSE